MQVEQELAPKDQQFQEFINIKLPFEAILDKRIVHSIQNNYINRIYQSISFKNGDQLEDIDSRSTHLITKDWGAKISLQKIRNIKNQDEFIQFNWDILKKLKEECTIESHECEVEEQLWQILEDFEFFKNKFKIGQVECAYGFWDDFTPYGIDYDGGGPSYKGAFFFGRRYHARGYNMNDDIYLEGMPEELPHEGEYEPENDYDDSIKHPNASEEFGRLPLRHLKIPFQPFWEESCEHCIPLIGKANETIFTAYNLKQYRNGNQEKQQEQEQNEDAIINEDEENLAKAVIDKKREIASEEARNSQRSQKIEERRNNINIQ